MTNATHTLDWEHIWTNNSRSEVRLYLRRDADGGWEFITACGIYDGQEYVLAPQDIEDIHESFDDNAGSGYEFDDEAVAIRK